MRAAQSHTASVAGTAAVNSAVFRQFGAIEVDDLDQLLAVSQLLTRASAKSGNGLCIYTFSGGTAALAADLAGAARRRWPTGARHASRPGRAAAGFRQHRQSGGHHRRHPAQSGSLGRMPAHPMRRSLGRHGAVSDSDGLWRHHGRDGRIHRLGGLADGHPDRAGLDEPPAERRLLRDGTGGPAALPVAVGRHRRPVPRHRLESRAGAPAALPPAAGDARALSEADAKAMLRDAGLPMPAGRIARSADEPPPMPPRWAFRGHESGQRADRAQDRSRRRQAGHRLGKRGAPGPCRHPRSRGAPPPRRPHRRRAGRAHAAAGRARGADRRAPRRGLRPGDDFRPGRHLRRDPARRGAPHDPARPRMRAR